MKKEFISLLLILGFILPNHAQDGGVVSFDVPAKNSLKFNKFLINPTFSFVREDESFISMYNKRQFSGFENAPQAYFASYSGKFREDNGIAFGLFQRNYGVLTTFGIVGNFARNIELSNDSNFTFGLNLAYVNSGLNTGKIVTNTTDPALQNIPKNSLATINPGINYSSGLMDFGISANNIFFYNFGSGLVTDDPTKSFVGHIMYTGYMNNSGLFENGKFSVIVKGEAAKEKTIFSSNLLINAPNAGWIQAGYNSLYGVSGGVGLTIAKKLSIGYTIEKGIGNLSNFGLSHEITLAYKLKGYGDFEDYKPIVKATKKTNPGTGTKGIAVKKKSPAELQKERAAALALKAEQDKARLEAERLRREKDLADAKAKAEADAALKKSEAERLLALQGKDKALLEAERLRKEKDAADARANAANAARLKAEQDKANALADAERLRKEKADAAAQAKIDAAAKAKEAADKLISDAAKAKTEAERLRKEKADADAKANADAAARAKEAADKLKSEQDKAKAEAERLRKEKADADAKANADAAARAKEAADKLKSEQDRAKAEAERLRKEKADADAKAIADAAARAKEAADKLKSEQDKAKAEAERLRKEKADADAKAKLDAEKALANEAIAKAEAERLRKEKELADAKAKADAEAERLRKEAETKAKIDAAKTAEDKELDNLSQVLDDSKKNQNQSLSRLDSIAKAKENELKELKRVNDLSDKGIVTEAKEFQSTTAANRALESLKLEIAENTKNQNNFIREFEALTNERLKKVPNKNDVVNQNYLRELEKLKAEKLLADKRNQDLLAKLETIKAETDIEKKRRIKRAAFDSDDTKYKKDRETLNQIKLKTTPTGQVYKAEDFDFGEEQSGTQIIKNTENVEAGYYLVVAAHKDEAKRDAFITKAIQAGQTNIDFFYNANNGTYYIYYQKVTDIEDATKAIEAKGSKPYNGKMVVIKIEK